MSRSLVHALSFGSTHQLGPEDGLGGQWRKTAEPKAATSTFWSPQVLKFFFLFSFFLPPIVPSTLFFFSFSFDFSKLPTHSFNLFFFPSLFSVPSAGLKRTIVLLAHDNFFEFQSVTTHKKRSVGGIWTLFLVAS